MNDLRMVEEVGTFVKKYSLFDNPCYKCSPEIIERKALPMVKELIRYRKPLYIKKSGDEILVGIVSYMEKISLSDQTLFKQTVSGAVNNLINEKYLNSIQSSEYNLMDSIAFKESYIRFK